MIATTKVPLEVGKEEVKWHFTSFLSEFSEKGVVEKQISCVPSPPKCHPPDTTANPTTWCWQ
ncbi:hypothetical protein [Eubacterium sp.]|uniref:hypothetical protein n=1 Tax=Eubacterium sp. TaxID=142586 RepID=UPI003522456C